jgi:cytochrome b
MKKILIWDWPTRMGHWLMATAFLVAYLTGESEEWRLVHVMAGGTLAGIVVFRLIWGLVGSRHARFASFLRSPKAAFNYLRGLFRGQPEHYAGHNPAAGWAITLLLGLGLAAAATGWPLYQEIGGDWLEGAHEVVVNFMLAIVFVHLAGVLVGSLAHKENLPKAMVTGYKLGSKEEEIRKGRPWALALLLAFAALGGWWLSL